MALLVNTSPGPKYPFQRNFIFSSMSGKNEIFMQKYLRRGPKGISAIPKSQGYLGYTLLCTNELS